MASRIKGITIEIGANTTKLQTALKSVNSQIRSTNDSLRDINKLLKFNPGNTDLLKQKQQQLREAIAQTAEKLKTLQDAQKQMDASGVSKSSSEYQRLQREIIETENKLESLNNEFKNFGSVASQQIIAAGEKMQQVGQNIKAVGDSIANVGSKLTRNVTMPIVAVGTAAVKTAADYEASMSEVRAITGASDEDFQKLSDTAREWGTNSVFAADEVAAAYKYMGMAGWDAEQMLDGLPGILNLAAASGEELASVSDIVTDGLTAFGMQASQAGEFSDTLAAAATNANTNVAMMGESFKNAAPAVGALFGDTMENAAQASKDTAIALGLMANAGIKGSQAGTTLRTVLQNMANPTESMQKAMDALGVSLEDDEGNMLSLMDVMQQLRGGFGELKISEEELTTSMTELDAAFDDGTLSEKEYAEAQQELMERAYGAEGAMKAQQASMLGGSRAMSGLLAIVNASDKDFNKLTTAIYNSNGAAKRMASVMQNNLKGELTKLKNNLKELGIQFGNVMMPAIKKTVEKIQDLVKWLQNLTPQQREQVVKIAAITAAIGPLVLGAGKLISAFGSLTTTAGKLVSGFGKLTTVMVAHPYATVAVGAVALAAGIAKIADAMEETPLEAFRAKMATINDEMASVRQMTQEYQILEQQRQANVAAVEQETSYSRQLKTELDTLLSSDRQLTTAEQERANFIASTLMNSLGIEYDANGDLIAQYQSMAGEIETLMEKQRQKALLSANEEMYTEAIRRQGEASNEAMKAYNLYQEAVQAAQGPIDAYKAAQENLTAAQEKYNGTADSTGTLFQSQQMSLQQAEAEMIAAQAEVEKLSQEYLDAQVAADSYSAAIANYQAASAAVVSGSANAEAALQQLNQGFITAETGTAASLARQVVTANQKYQELVQAIQNRYLEADDAAVQGALKLVQDSIAEFDKLPADSKKAIEPLGNNLATGIEQARSNVQTASQTVTKAGVDKMAQEGKSAKNSGTSTSEAYAQGISQGKGTVTSNSQSVAQAGVDQMKTTGGAAKGSGESTGSAYAIGIRSKEGEVRQAARQLANAANEELKNVQVIKSPSKRWIGYGEDTGEGYKIGMLNKLAAIKEAANKIAIAPDTKKVNTSTAPLQNAHTTQKAQTNTRIINAVESISSALSDLVTLAEMGGDMYIDKNVLIGRLMPGINRWLGTAARATA